MAEEPRFDWPTIWRSIAIIVAVPTVIGFGVPPLLTLAFGQVNTGYAAGNEIFNWGFWLVAWGLTFARAAYFLRHVGDKIIDDMLVVAIISAFLLVVIKLMVALVYLPLSADGKVLPIMGGADAGGALMIIIVALVGARLNRY